MHFDIIEAFRQKQQKQQRGIRIENGKVVVNPEISHGLEPEEEIDVPPDDEGIGD